MGLGKWVSRSLAVIALAGLAACGGGGSGASGKGSIQSSADTVSIQGFAPSQTYTLQAKDASGNVVATATPDAQGQYALNVTGHTGPFLIVATPVIVTSSGEAASAASASVASGQSSQLNINAVLFAWVDAIPTPSAGQSAVSVANVNALSTWAIEQSVGISNNALMSAVPSALSLSQSQLDTGIRNLVLYNLPPAVYKALLAKGIDVQTQSLLSAANGGDVNAVLQQQQLARDFAGVLQITVSVAGSNVVAPISANALHKPTQISIVPGTACCLNAGATYIVSVTETFDNGSSGNLAIALLNWSVSGDASFDGRYGVLVAGSQNFTLNATFTPAISGNTPLSSSVSYVVTSSSTKVTGLSINNAPVLLLAGSFSWFGATASFADGATNVPVPCTWSVNNTSIATINSTTGLLTILNPTVDTPITVTAQYSSGGVTVSATATVIAQAETNPIVSAAIVGGSSVPSGVAAKYQLSVTYRDGSTATLQPVQWAVSDIRRANIDYDGTLNSARLTHSLPLTISAKANDPLTNFPVTVPPLTVTLLPYQPASISDVTVHGYLQLGAQQTVNYVVTANLDGEVLDVTSLATLSSGDNTVLSINGSSVTAHNPSGQPVTTSLRANYSGVYSSTITVTVVPVVPTLTSLFIVAPPVVSSGTTANLRAIATWSNGIQRKVGVADGVTFSGDNNAVFSVNNGQLLAATVSSDQTANVNASLIDSNNSSNTVAAGATPVTVDALTGVQYLQQGIGFPAAVSTISSVPYDHFSANSNAQNGWLSESTSVYWTSRTAYAQFVM